MRDNLSKDPDICNKHNFENFKKKYIKWLDRLDGQQATSILNSLSEINEAHNFYKVFLFASELSKQKASCLNNIPFRKFMIKNYYDSQTVRIYNLLEQDKKGNKNTIYNLLEDMKENNILFSRENYVAGFDDTPYEFEQGLDKLYETIGAGNAVWVSGKEQLFFDSERRHKKFDELAKIEKCNRKRCDTLTKELFGNWQKDIQQKGKKIYEYRNSHVAHKSHSALKLPSIKFTEFDLAVNELIEKFQLIFGVVLNYASFSFLSLDQTNLMHLQHPFIVEDDFTALKIKLKDDNL